MSCKRSRKESEIQEFKYTDKTNVEHATYDCTSDNWSHRNSNKRFKGKLGSHAKKTFNRCTTKDSYTRNITHNMESAAVRNWKPEWWGSLLVQEKYQEEKVCDKR